MKYEGVDLTRNNYRSVLEGYDNEILEIVELCIKDNTDIGKYIARCRSDGYRLWEIRQCIKHNMPKQLYEKIRFPKVLQKLRKSKSEGKNIKTILSYMSTKYTEKAMLCVIDLAEDGYDLTGYNLSVISDDCIDLFAECIKEGIDIREYINKKGATNREIFARIQSLTKKGMNTEYFLTQDWTPYQLDVIIENLAYTDYYDKVMPYIKPETMNPYYIEQGIYLVKRGMKSEEVFTKKLSEIITMNSAIEAGVKKDWMESKDITTDEIRIKAKIEKRKKGKVHTL